MFNLGVAVVLSVAGGSDGVIERVARLHARALVDVCEAYCLSPDSNNQYPINLATLVNPPGGRSLLRNGAKDLLDPWGQPFKYELVVKPDGTPYPRVWTERTVGGKTKAIGYPPPPKKP